MNCAWYRRARESQFAHYAAAARYSARSRLLGIPSVVLSAAVGTTLFATLGRNGASANLRIAAGLVSLFAAVLVALQTFLGLAELADKHRSAASTYGAIRREIEQHQALPPATRDAVQSTMAALRKRLDEIASSSPDVPESIWDKAQKAIADTTRPEGFRDEAS